ncbi:MAG: CRTAC1 family protein [Thermoanaerobaculia bacterium]
MTRCGPLLLRDATESAGVTFRHRRGGRGEKHLPETMGAGVAWLDFDGDGWLDLYLVQSGPFPPDGSAAAGNRLFRNLGDGRFVDVTVKSSAGERGYGQGVVAADVDGDGSSDLYLTNYGPDALLANQGDGTFADRTRAAGLGLDGWSSSAALADADADGDLDLYVTRYVEYDPEEQIFCGDPTTGEREYCDPSLFVGSGDRFYRNRGNGTFEDATEATGIGAAGGRGLGVVFVDLDGDRRPDVYVANDETLNFLFRNLGSGRFEDLSLASGTAANRDGKPEGGMGIAVGDVDGDLDPDLAVTNFDVETNTLYRNLGEMLFEDVAAASGFGMPSFNLLAFGIGLLDLDLDGDLDFYIANGHIFERPERENVTHAQRAQVLLGDGRGRFSELRCRFLDERPMVARGLAAADFDNDGDPDLALLENGGPAVLLENGTRSEWVGVTLRGAPPNTEAVGSRVVLVSDRGRQVRWILAGDSYQSSSDRRALFGFGDSLVDAVEIIWPSGRSRRLISPPTGRYLVVRE